MRVLSERRARRRVGLCSAFAALSACADVPTQTPLANIDPRLDVTVAATWTATLLTLPAGATTSAAADVNDRGIVVGAVTLQGVPGPHAVRWRKGRPKLLTEPEPLGQTSSTVATAINNGGLIVGFWNPGVGENRAVYWKKSGKVTVLTGLQGGASDFALGVNDAGVIVGQSQNHAVRWVDGVVDDLHPAGYAESRANDINSAGDITGWVEAMTGERRAYLWHADGSEEVLGVLVGDVHSEANAVNDALAVVGNSGDLFSTSRAFLWTEAAGMVDSQLGASETFGRDVGGSGRIVGYREFTANSQFQAVALTKLGTTVDTLPNPVGLIGRAQAVNVCGTVVGTVESSAPSSGRAVVWTQQGCD